jgi:thioredoxin-dependent peroxiredoxin
MDWPEPNFVGAATECRPTVRCCTWDGDIKREWGGHGVPPLQRSRERMYSVKTTDGMKMSKTRNTEVGQTAPDFTLPDGENQRWNLSCQRGKVVVLLFYPGDETPVCTRQMCSVRDRWDDYSATGAEVVGISTDSVESHQKFSAHHDLPLRLLSDEGGNVARLYGAKSLIPGKVARSVFVIDAKGTIRYREVRPIGLFRPRDENVLQAIREAQG